MNSYASPNTLIVSALSGIVPCGHLQYLGDEPKYCIFRISNRIPEVIGSGINQMVGCYGYVDLFSNEDESGRNGLAGQIATALKNAGILVRNVADIGLESDVWHIEFEVYISSEVI